MHILGISIELAASLHARVLHMCHEQISVRTATAKSIDWLNPVMWHQLPNMQESCLFTAREQAATSSDVA